MKIRELRLYALAALGQKYDHVWSSDRAREVKAFIQHNHCPNVFFDDVAKRNVKKLGTLADDGVYCAGFPCVWPHPNRILIITAPLVLRSSGLRLNTTSCAVWGLGFRV